MGTLKKHHKMVYGWSLTEQLRLAEETVGRFPIT